MFKKALTVASSDCSGGAGIQADLKAFSGLGVHGASIITCITAQNAQRVYSIHELPLMSIEEQFEAVFENLMPDATKTGMLYSPEIVRLVSEKVECYRLKAVVDPVMRAGSGRLLVRDGFLESLVRELIPRALIVTPNLYEAGKITGKRVGSVKEMRSACKSIHDLGCRNVLIKGGHLRGKAVDILYDGEFKVFEGERIKKKVHGTGCTFSAYITGFIAKGDCIEDSVRKAKELITQEIGIARSEGEDVLNPFSSVRRDAERFTVLIKTRKAIKELESFIHPKLIPKLGINLGYALSSAESLNDVCALEGRLIKVGENAKAVGDVNFGVSRHVATIILTAMRFNPELRSVVNLKYSPEILKACRKAGLKIGSFDRQKELSCPPDVIYDEGCIGKEAMIRILGRSPEEVLEKVRMIITP